MLSNINIKDVKIRLGDLVKILRKKEKLTQEELGGKLALSRITIQNLESGKNATMDTVFTVLQYFGMLDNFNELIKSEITNNSYESLY
jgi:transcriptional regulator with XRE-family HTH domain